MAQPPPLEMAQAPATIPRIITDMERCLYRIAYGLVWSHGVEEDDSYLKDLANEIYIYLRKTQTYDPQGKTINPAVDKGELYEHIAGTDEGLDGQFGPYHFDMPATRYTCTQCNTRTFCKSQNLVLHLVWYMNPVVEKAPNDPDELQFVATDTWLYRFKEKYLWPEGLYINPVRDLSASRDIDDLVTEFIEAPTLEMAKAPPLEMARVPDIVFLV